MYATMPKLGTVLLDFVLIKFTSIRAKYSIFDLQLWHFLKTNFISKEAVVQRCSVKKMFLEIS